MNNEAEDGKVKQPEAFRNTFIVIPLLTYAFAVGIGVYFRWKTKFDNVMDKMMKRVIELELSDVKDYLLITIYSPILIASICIEWAIKQCIGCKVRIAEAWNERSRGDRHEDGEA